jgi:hypothetical protein
MLFSDRFIVRCGLEQAVLFFGVRHGSPQITSIGAGLSQSIEFFATP